ncbi:MAG: thiamine-phosphate kinase [Methanomassiliicoccales archaeon]|jgi:thiamine-monophosphate kinase|nr:thiamine-phosphate kinase [Methanomassiliicoccales archaeon]
MSRLSEIGEKEAVRRIQELVASRGATSNIGPGDDAAAVDLGVMYLVATTDILGQATHILPGMTYWQVGWTLAAVNFSDVAAMGAKPIGLLVSMGLPRDFASESLDEMLDGILDCCDHVKAELLGGDTKETKEVTLAGTALGTVGKKEILLRRGASVGDLLAVTGSVGMAAAGYHSLRKGLGVKAVEKAILEPQPHVQEGMALSSSHVVTSCMDVSDGLASSVHTLGGMSGVSFTLDYDEIPVDDEVLEVAGASGVDANELALYFGGDYQLLFTLRPQGLERLRSLLGDGFTVIGKAGPRGADNVIVRGRDIIRLENRGYEHFR